MRFLLSCKVKALKIMSDIYLRFSVTCCLSPPYQKIQYVKLHSLLQNGMGNFWFQTANVKKRVNLISVFYRDVRGRSLTLYVFAQSRSRFRSASVSGGDPASAP